MFPFYSWGRGAAGRQRNMPEGTQHGSGRARTRQHAPGPPLSPQNKPILFVTRQLSCNSGGVFLKFPNFWPLEKPQLRDESMHLATTALITFDYEMHAEHNYHSRSERHTLQTQPPARCHRRVINTTEHREAQCRRTHTDMQAGTAHKEQPVPTQNQQSRNTETEERQQNELNKT